MKKLEIEVSVKLTMELPQSPLFMEQLIKQIPEGYHHLFYGAEINNICIPLIDSIMPNSLKKSLIMQQLGKLDGSKIELSVVRDTLKYD